MVSIWAIFAIHQTFNPGLGLGELNSALTTFYYLPDSQREAPAGMISLLNISPLLYLVPNTGSSKKKIKLPHTFPVEIKSSYIKCTQPYLLLNTVSICPLISFFMLSIKSFSPRIFSGGEVSFTWTLDTLLF